MNQYNRTRLAVREELIDAGLVKRSPEEQKQLDEYFKAWEDWHTFQSAPYVIEGDEWDRNKQWKNGYYFKWIKTAEYRIGCEERKAKEAAASRAFIKFALILFFGGFAFIWVWLLALNFLL